MDELKAPGKPFGISKRAVWEAWEKVKANKGAPGVDAVSVAEFESDLKNNLYKIWNRLSSGTYFPPPVRAVEIPKPHGEGTRILGVPTVADRVAQTVVAGVIEARAEQVFHPDSYGYRPCSATRFWITTPRRSERSREPAFSHTGRGNSGPTCAGPPSSSLRRTNR